MEILLYDTWERSLRPFSPIHADWVGLYCCGPTVYDHAHIGNLRTYLFEDLLRRTLEFNGYTVRHVVNITDVGHLLSDQDEGEDKVERQSRRSGVSAWALAERYTEAFITDLGLLNIQRPTIWCKATDHIKEQIALIESLDERGYTYRTQDGVYFDTSRQEGYGYLARLDKAGLDAGARVSMGEKRSATDFALWKFSRADEQRQMEWTSPWGTGFPGWHSECSAMSCKYLGPWFDIHCGGEDHVPVHHTNEIAQNEARHGTRLANFWLHGHFLQVDKTKMSKSSGDFLRLRSLIDEGVDPLAFRYLCLGAHYRSHLNFSWSALQGASAALNRLRQKYFELPDGGDVDPDFIRRFRTEVNRDLSTANGLAMVWDLLKSTLPDARKKATLAAVDAVLGLCLAQWSPDDDKAIPEPIRKLLHERTASRASRDWGRSDALRAEIEALGYAVEDCGMGTRIRRR
ncbi:cysteine--tRNA ligase [Burkholderia sp. JP2-270]|uniref:cysteine--tRNA ligase n=1 Tax=Burkholderia sp. JP2-270 TaxID=2217913 RepID=UPI000DA33014|nr:cysteine--tRNA ligase [Burkholderia sp. JP2-270]AWV05250.1 cysteine--tRNA ligase [Burkholderia sp. JP2-270]